MSALNETEEFEFLYQLEKEAQAGIPPPNPAPVKASMGDVIAGTPIARFAMGAASPLIGAAQLGAHVGDAANKAMGVEPMVSPWIDKKLGQYEAAKQRGMKAAGDEGFDAMGLIGSLLPGAAVAKGVTSALPAATSALGRIGTGAAIGGATSAAQPVTNSPDFWSDKGKQVGVGAAVGGAIPAAGEVVESLRGSTPQLNPVKAATLKEGQAAGYVVPPSAVNPSFLTNRLESVAGKAAVGQEAAKRNQEITNILAARSLGLPPGTPLSERVLGDFREQAAQPYRDVSALAPSRLEGMKVKTIESRPTLPGPATGVKVKEVRGEAPNVFGLKAQETRDEAGNLLGMRVGTSSKADKGPLESVKATVTTRGQSVPGPLEGLKVSVQEKRSGDLVGQLKDARFNANNYYKHYGQSADPESLQKAQQFAAKAKEIEEKLDDIATKAGRPELINALAEARMKIAKSYDVERALNLGTGDVSAAMVGRQLDKAGLAGKSGELATIGKMAEAFPSVMREGARIPAAGVSGTDAASSAILGTLGYGAGGPAGILAAGLPLLRGPARNLVLSKAYQKFATADPSKYQAIIDALAQQGAGAAGSAAGRGVQP